MKCNHLGDLVYSSGQGLVVWGRLAWNSLLRLRCSHREAALDDHMIAEVVTSMPLIEIRSPCEL